MNSIATGSELRQGSGHIVSPALGSVVTITTLARVVGNVCLGYENTGTSLLGTGVTAFTMGSREGESGTTRTLTELTAVLANSALVGDSINEAIQTQHPAHIAYSIIYGSALIYNGAKACSYFFRKNR